jgi:preprotein translocase subunit SecA
MVRKDQADVIYKGEQGKFKAIAQEIKRLHEKGQPVLVGTVSVEKSERLSHLLKGLGIKHNVLNAKQHEREAEIVAQAGRKGSVTIATNMAGRGTDILLGGNADFMAKHEVGPAPTQTPEMSAEEFEALTAEHQRKLDEAAKKWKDTCSKERDEVKAAGGLFILGTERHESRRIDNQLRGRAGRQGDPGESRFYLSLDDDLMRIFGSVNIGRFMEEDLPIEHKWITNAIANAQKKVEGHHYDVRKHLLEYDDVMNQQRKVVYAWRREVLAQENLKEMIFSMVKELAANIGEEFFPRGKLRKDNSGQSHLDINELNNAVRQTFQIDSNIREADISPFNNVGLAKLITDMAEKAYAKKTQDLGPEMMGQVERMILLTTIDHLWKDHLLAMDHLREGINLNAYGQKDPLIEYKKQGFNFFQMMMGQITSDVVRKIFAVQLAQADDMQHAHEGIEEVFEQDLEDEMAETFPEQSMQYNIADDGTLVPADGSAPSEAEAAAHPAPAQGVAPDLMSQMRAPRQMSLSRGPMGGGLLAANGPMAEPMPSSAGGGSDVDKVGRNDLCPCGSGKKYKKCHGA